LNNIFVSWKQKIESRIISDLKSQYTESEEQIRQRKEQFLKKQKKIILIEIIAGAVFLAFLIIRAAFLQDDILLSRNSFGQGSKEVQLSLKKDDKKKEITYKLDEQKLSAEEESKVYIQFFKKLKKIMMKNNTSLKQIQTPLNLPDTVDGYPFEITYELAEDGYIRLDGSINEEEQAKLKRGETYRTYIVVTARYGEYRKSKKYEIRIVPKKNISQTNVFYKIQQYLKKEEQENRYSRDIKIPSVYKDIEITKRQENQGGISGILILFVTVCIFIPLHNYLKLQEEGKKCQEQAERDFPVIVHLLTLYMGAGLSFFSAVKRISQNYQKQRELDDSKKYAFEKMMRMEQQMSNGVSQREACQDWGMQFRTDSYQKLSLILIQSFTKGGREAAMLMEVEEREAFHKRIDRAKKEEANKKDTESDLKGDVDKNTDNVEDMKPDEKAASEEIEPVSEETLKERSNWKEIKGTLQLLMRTGILFYAAEHPESLSRQSIPGTNLPSKRVKGSSFDNEQRLLDKMDELSFSSLKGIKSLLSVDISMDGRGTLWTKDRYIISYIEDCFSFYGSSDKKDNALLYEVEYLISGKNSDIDNLKRVANYILLLRFINNYIFTGKDTQMKMQINTMASAITGVMGMPQTMKAVQVLIRMAISYGESLLELHTLFSGGEVPLIKDKTTWNLTLKTMAEQLRNKQIVKKGKKNISYKDYLKLFLLTKGNSRTVCYRMMDIMQENIASKEPGFLMENCLFSYSWKGSLTAGGVKLNFVKQCSY